MRYGDNPFGHGRMMRSTRNTRWQIHQQKEPKWVPWVGGAAMGCLIALMLYCGVGL